jgi:hypothetical protein
MLSWGLATYRSYRLCKYIPIRRPVFLRRHCD